MKLWVDDLREPPEEDWLWARDSASAIFILKQMRNSRSVVSTMSLDHDLGGDDTTRQVMIWMCVCEYWPLEVRVHTANPVGREWLEGMIERYKP